MCISYLYLCYILLDESKAKEWVNQQWQNIVNKVDLFRIRPYLFEKGVLSRVEYEKLSQVSQESPSLIDILGKHSESECPFSHLKQAIAQSDTSSHLLDRLHITGENLLFFYCQI